MTAISTARLSAGADLIVEPMPGVRSAAMTWLLPAGSAREPAAFEGLGAMWADLLFRGAGGLDARQHAGALDRLGVSRSADGATHTFRITGTMLGDRVVRALPLFADMVLRPRFDPADIGPVRDLCLADLAALADDPHERVMILAKARHLPAPLNRSGLGTPETLAAIDAPIARAQWRAQAAPAGSAIAVAGAVEPEPVRDALERLLEGWTGEPTAFEAAGPARRGREHLDDDTNQVHIAVVHDAPPESAPECVLERVLTSVLSGGMSGRLFTEVREKRGLVYSVSARYAAGRDDGRVVAYAGTTPERAPETLRVLLGELGRPTAEGDAGGIDESEFRRAVTGLKSSLVMSGESTAARASALAGDWFTLGRPRTLAERLAEIDAVTLDALNAYAAKRTLGELTIASIGPAGSMDAAG
ncbi:MAG: insulinase family protein [Planctomycetota bacterium]|nr:MAG: insulinase family protein [Planctomycetota bacterium]